jgi:hypothetical protein
MHPPFHLGTGDVARHLADDAVAGWLSLPGPRFAPSAVTLVQAGGHSAVYRLHNVTDGTHVIAKRLDQDGLEREMYEFVLPHLDVNSARYLGTGTGIREEWMFLEDLGGQAYNWALARHREAAARWLFTMHAASLASRSNPALPARDLPYWKRFLAAVRESPPPTGTATYARALSEVCDELRDQWDAVERVSRCMPETLVHGDLVPKNICVLDDGAAVCPIDWGSAGIGITAIDFAYVDARAYWLAARESGHNLSLEDIRQLSSLGRLFRDLMLVWWLHQEPSQPAQFHEKLSTYIRWIRAELRMLRTVPA